jgi:CO dehydrogenase/acetyl-CoA synthase alpha subunit
MSQQIRLRRAQDKRFQRTTEPEEADVVPILSNSAIGATNATSPDQQQTNQQAIAEAMADQQQLMDAKNMCYFCQKCKNHGILVWKKVRLMRGIMELKGVLFDENWAIHFDYISTRNKPILEGNMPF